MTEPVATARRCPGRGHAGGLFAELRAVGIPVSLSENIDATAAVLAMPITGRDALRSALAATLVKNNGHARAFDLVFDIFFAGRRPGPPSPVAPVPDGAARRGPRAPGRLAGRSSPH